MEYFMICLFSVFILNSIGCTPQSAPNPADKKPGAEGMTTLPSGLKYRVITEGTGVKPGPTQTVEVHYRGQFADGREFDSSYKRGQPAQFPVNGE